MKEAFCDSSAAPLTILERLYHNNSNHLGGTATCAVNLLAKDVERKAAVMHPRQCTPVAGVDSTIVWMGSFTDIYPHVSLRPK